MEKTLNFHDRKGTCLLRLTPAKAEYSGTDLLRTAVEFNVGAFAGRIRIDTMSYDFANLRKGLTAIYEGRISHYGFVTMEDELSMDFLRKLRKYATPENIPFADYIIKATDDVQHGGLATAGGA